MDKEEILKHLKKELEIILLKLNMEDQIWALIWKMPHETEEFIKGHNEAAQYRCEAIDLIEKLIDNLS